MGTFIRDIRVWGRICEIDVQSNKDQQFVSKEDEEELMKQKKVA